MIISQAMKLQDPKTWSNQDFPMVHLIGQGGGTSARAAGVAEIWKRGPGAVRHGMELVRGWGMEMSSFWRGECSTVF